MQILQIDDNADDTRSYSINTRALALPQAARLPRHHEADAVLSRFGIVGLVVTYINKTNTKSDSSSTRIPEPDIQCSAMPQMKKFLLTNS